MRFVAWLSLIVTMFHAAPAPFAAEPTAVTSEKAACETLKRAAIESYLSTHNLAGRYYCETLREYPEHFVLGLRYHVNPDELVGSNLIGWFAVAKANGRVLDWDITEDRALPLAPRPPFRGE